jgi:O-antigen ligase
MKTLEEKNTKVDKMTSGRSIIWKRAIEIIKEEKIILGYGPQADRYIFTKDLKLGVNNQKYHENVLFWDSNVSNAFIYSYLCGGFVGLCLLIIIYFLAIKEIYIAIKIEKNFFNNSLLYNFSFITLIYLSLRGLFENSIALFSLDFCIYIVTYFIVKENKKKIHI